MDRFSTGVPGLDSILCGGMPTGTLAVIAGAPGTGKTILAQQISSWLANSGQKVLYFTTISEPHEKMIAFLGEFSFFDQGKIGQEIELISLHPKIQERDAKSLTDFVVAMARDRKASLVVIDGMKPLIDIYSETDYRMIVFDLGARLSALHTACFLLGAYRQSEFFSAEFTVSDMIIHLDQASRNPLRGRSLRLVKTRGIGVIEGDHSMIITPDGIRTFPRQEMLYPMEVPKISDEKVPFGVESLDNVLTGGIPKGSNVLIQGNAGTGKTILATRFLATGMEAGEKSLMISFRDSQEEVIRKAGTIGIPLETYIANGNLAFQWHPVSHNIDIIAEEVRNTVQELGVSRLVIDSILELAKNIADPGRHFSLYLRSLLTYLSARGVTSLLTLDRDDAMLQLNEAVRDSLTVSWDNVLDLKSVEKNGDLQRVLSITKALLGQTDNAIHRTLLTPEGLVIGKMVD